MSDNHVNQLEGTTWHWCYKCGDWDWGGNCAVAEMLRSKRERKNQTRSPISSHEKLRLHNKVYGNRFPGDETRVDNTDFIEYMKSMQPPKTGIALLIEPAPKTSQELGYDIKTNDERRELGLSPLPQPLTELPPNKRNPETGTPAYTKQLKTLNRKILAAAEQQHADKLAKRYLEDNDSEGH